MRPSGSSRGWRSGTPAVLYRLLRRVPELRSRGPSGNARLDRGMGLVDPRPMPRTPKTSETALRVTIDRAVRATLIDHIAAHPDFTLADLIALEGDLGAPAASLRVRELVGGRASSVRSSRRPTIRRRVASKSAKRPASKPARQSGPRRRPPAPPADTKTKVARQAYDGAILGLLKAKRRPMSPGDVRAACGGTPLQVRTALHRLEAARRVKRSGRGGQTRYRAG